MPIKMVKKQLANGEPCRKCNEAEELLRSRGLWGQIDEVVWAVDGQPQSAGMVLGERHGVTTAPFFIVNQDGDEERVYQSALMFIREVFPTKTLKRLSSPSRHIDVDAIAVQYRDKHPSEILYWALERFGEQCAIAFSGAEDVALIDMAVKTGQPFSVFCLDTGRLHPETYQFIEQVRTHYKIEIEMMAPDPTHLQPFVRKKGLFSFYEDGHQECCGIRKVEPLRRALLRHSAWVAGQRVDQSPATRADVPLIQKDSSFEGLEESLIKLNPLNDWSSASVWNYIRSNDVPFNPLHERGFISIGCEPCTRPTHPGQHEREGRWSWEEATQKECGLHSEHDAAE